MQQATLSVKNEKMPLLKDVLQSIKIEDNYTSSSSSYKNISDSMRDSANSLIKKYLSWEYYINELEFE